MGAPRGSHLDDCVGAGGDADNEEGDTEGDGDDGDDGNEAAVGRKTIVADEGQGAQ